MEIKSQDVCLKWKGRPIAIPDHIFISVEFTEGRNVLRTLDQLCQDPGRKECAWNRRFHNSYPFDITIRTTNGRALREYMKLVRVLRNGELVFSWNGATAGATEDQHIHAPGSAIQANLQPYRADLDLRIIPATVDVAEEVLKQTVAKRRLDWRDQLERAKGALLAVASDSAIAGGALPQVYKCFQQHVQVIQHLATGLAAKAPGTAPEPDAACDGAGGVLTKARKDAQGEGFSLSDDYLQIKNGTAEELKKKEQEIDQKLSKLAGISQGYLAHAKELAKKKIIEWLQKNPDKQPQVLVRVQESLQSLDALTQETLALFDAVAGLQGELRKDVVRLAADKDEQARLFAKLAESLEKQGSIFVPWTPNPPVLPGEQQLHMEYADRLQFFLLAPWHMVGIRLTGVRGTTFGAENAVPAIDVLGARFQWAKSRFADFRIAAGVVYVHDQYSVDEMGMNREVSEHNLALQANLSLANFKVGLGYTMTNGFPGTDGLRLLLGVDVLKLISGQNIEAF